MLLVAVAGFSLPHPATALIVLAPAWLWALVGLLLALPARPGRRWLLFAWALYSLVYVEQVWTLWRQPGEATGLRVVSLNCAGGRLEAAREATRLEPDLLLLQEAPARGLEELGFPYLIATPEAAILARRPLAALPLSGLSRTYAARARMGPITVISLRLPPPILTLDPLVLARDRRHRQELLRDIASAPRPMILGGDFNVPPGDATFHSVPEGLRDAFRIAGRGWGTTAPQDWPLFRIDQLWTDLEVRDAVSLATAASDHRLLRVELKGP